MKYSDYLKRMLLSAIDEMADTPDLYARNPGKDFTRNRKMGFKQFLILFLTMEGDCIRKELYRFFGRTTNAPSKAAFYKQRQKLQDDALPNLFFAFNAKLKNGFLRTSTSSSPAMGRRWTFTGTRMTPTLSLGQVENPPEVLTRSM